MANGPDSLSLFFNYYLKEVWCRIFTFYFFKITTPDFEREGKGEFVSIDDARFSTGHVKELIEKKHTRCFG